MPTGEKEHLELKNMLKIDIYTDKLFSDKTVTIRDKEAIEKLQDYLNSLELIELERDYERSCRGNIYMMFMPYNDISIQGKYLSVLPSGADDKVYTEYYIVDSGYDPITGSSKVSRFMNKLIRKYGEEK